MPTAQQIARFRAIDSSRKAQPANDDQPKVRLKVADFVGTLDDVEDIKIADDAQGNPYLLIKGATVTSAQGNTMKRTVMAFEAYDAVRPILLAGQIMTAKFRHAGGTLKIVGVQVDGEMVSFDRAEAAAA